MTSRTKVRIVADPLNLFATADRGYVLSMGLLDRIRSIFRRRRGGVGDLDRSDIRSLVEDSLEETEATSEYVERAQDAHDRARDLMRQGLFDEALGRFREALEAWEDQAAVCRDRGFKNMWRGKPEQVGREMEDLRIAHLDVLDLDRFRYLRKRAEIRRAMLGRLLALADSDTGVTETQVHEAFADHQREDVRSMLFHAQNRGWLVRRPHRGRYTIHRTERAPDIGQTASAVPEGSDVDPEEGAGREG
jgi:hypothetical protein